MSASNIHSSKDVAKKRWVLLAKMLKQRKCELQNENGDISVRRFSSFGLLKTSLLNYEMEGKRHLWYDYSCRLQRKSMHCYIRHLDASINLKDLLGFNNTGNVCVWPSEEVLTYYCLKNSELLRGKKVCELGGGMTCLAGAFISSHCDVSEMLLTDGNIQSAQNIQAIIDSSKNDFGNTFVHSRALLWNEYHLLGDLKGHFDTVICADCLFFDEYRQDLVNTLHCLLSSQGEAIMFAPRRGKTFDAFVSLSEELFTVQVTECYDENIWSLHIENEKKGLDAYDADIHYPLLLQLKKKDGMQSQTTS